MEKPDCDELLDLSLEDEDLFKSDLLTCPPGFESGLIFKSSSTAGDDGSDDDIDGLFSKLGMTADADDDDDENNSGESEVDDSNDDGDDDEESLDELEVLDSLVSSGGSSKQEAAPTPAAPAPAQEWAVNVNVSTSVDDFHQKVPQMAHQWPFELDTFQKQAVLHLEKYESVFVSAHTSAGKTVVAEYAIALAAKHMTRVVYTSPHQGAVESEVP